MKFFKIFGIIVLILAVLIIGAGYFILKNFDLNRYRERIAQELTQSFKREVRIGDLQLSVSLAQGLSLSVRSFQVASQRPQEDIIDVKEAQLKIDIKAFLERKEIAVQSIVLQSPRFQLLRSKTGQWDLPSTSSSVQGSVPVRPGEAVVPVAATEFGDFTIKELKIIAGQIRLEGFPEENSPDLTANQISLELKDFEMGKVTPFQFACALGAEEINVDVSGNLRLDEKRGELLLTQFELSSDLSRLPASEYGALLSTGKDVRFPPDFRAVLKARTEEVRLGKNGAEFQTVQGNLKTENIELAALPTAIRNLSVPFELSQKDLRVKDMEVQLGQDLLKVDMDVDDYLEGQDFAVTVMSEGLDLKQILPPFHPEIKMQGTLIPDLKLKGKGLSAEKALKTLVGQGSFEVRDGRLENINVLNVILSKISLLPGLVEELKARIPQKYKQSLQANETLFDQLTAKTQFQPDGLVLQDLTLSSAEIDVKAQGSVSWSQELSLEAKAWIPQDLAAEMIASVGELAALQEADGRLYIPLKPYSGPAKNYKPSPDLEYLGKKIVLKKGEEQVIKLFDKYIGREDSQAEISAPIEETPEEQQEQTPQQEAPSVEEQLIQGIFDAVFE